MLLATVGTATAAGASPDRFQREITVSPAKQPLPNYSTELQRFGVEGTVVLTGTIGANGEVSDVSILSGHPVLAKSAKRAISKWKYDPSALESDSTTLTVTVNFKMTKGSGQKADSVMASILLTPSDEERS